MPNTSVKGRVVDEHGDGIKDLTVTAVDFDPFFNEDDVLKSDKTAADGSFQLSYSEDDYSLWKADRNPDLVVRVFGPAGRLLYETKEEENFSAPTLDVGNIKIHRGNIEGWLVTNATLNPENGLPVSLFQGNEIKHLVDGDTMFPAVTQAVTDAQTSVNLMTLFFDVNNGFISKFKPESEFDPANPPSTNCKGGMESTLEEELKKKTGKPVNVLVTNIPLSADDTVTEVREFFQSTDVKTNYFQKGFSVLHSKAIILDGEKSILMGSPLKQSYFNDRKHAIHDVRHKGSLNHDVSIEITGPAVAQIDKTFETVWKATSQNLTTITPNHIAPRTGDNIASVQVLRTMPGGTFKALNPGDENLPHGETGILEAYQRAINNAERFIYIENQYFTAPDIVDALIDRMKDSAKPKLQIILVLNFRPDLPGYPNKQIEHVRQLKKAAKDYEHQLGAYTMWSRCEKGVNAEGKKEFETMPIYVHSKVAIIDDTWATVGSANLDGTSMNYHQVGLMASSAIAAKLLDKYFKLNEDLNFGKFIWDVYWSIVFYVFKQLFFDFKLLLLIIGIPYKLITDFKEVMELITETIGDITEIPEILKDVFARPAQHALPFRSRQPSRSIEMNLVLYNGIADQPATPVIKQLRDRLWQEQLGLEALPPDMQTVPDPANMKWVETWDAAAAQNQEAMKKKEGLPAERATKILPWAAKTNAEHYLEALGIRTANLRDGADKFLFKDCKFDTKKKLLPWPII